METFERIRFMGYSKIKVRLSEVILDKKYVFLIKNI